MSVTPSPLLNAPPEIEFHVVSAFCVILLGPMALFRRSRDRWHKAFGYCSVMAIFATAAWSFFILGRPMIDLSASFTVCRC